MIKKKLLILHPGFPKAATTLIQSHFNNFKDIENLYYEEKLTKYNDITNKLFSLKQSNNKNEKNIKYFIELINKNKNHNKSYIFSYEGIFNFYRFNKNQNLHNLFVIINELKKNFRIKILITLRNQIDLFNSLYISHYGILYDKYPTADDFIKSILYNDNFDLYDYNFLSKFIYEKTNIKANLIFVEDIAYEAINYEKQLINIIEKKIIKKLEYKKINKAIRAGDHYIVFSGRSFFLLSKFNTFLKKKIYFFEFYTLNIVSFIKKFFPQKIIPTSSLKTNLEVLQKYKNSNKLLFQQLEKDKKNKIYKKYFDV